MLLEAHADIRHHGPVKVRCGHAAKLVQGLKLEDDRDQLHGGVDALRAADVALAGGEPILQQMIEGNAQAVVVANRIMVKVMDVNLIVHVVLLRLVADEVVERILLHHIGSALANAAAEGKFIDVGILVDHIARGELFGEGPVAADTLLLIAIGDVFLRHLVGLRAHQLLLNHVLNGIDRNWLLHLLTRIEHAVAYALYLFFGQPRILRNAVICLYN